MHVVLSDAISVLLMDIADYRQEVARRVAAGDTYQRISSSLRQRHPSRRGFSARTVRRFCSREGIHYRSGLDEGQLDRVIASQVLSVGHSYGRRTMHGLLRAQGVKGELAALWVELLQVRNWEEDKEHAAT